MRIPEGLAQLDPMLDLRAGVVTADTLRRMFPPMESFVSNTRTLAKRRWHVGKIYVDINLATSKENQIRMAGYHIGDRTLLFDLVVGGDQMSVHTPLERKLYRGRIPKEGSPFGSTFGVEPSDLLPIFAVGQRLALSDPQSIPKEDEIIVLPGPGDLINDGLRMAVFEPESGLPKRLSWQRGEAEWDVEYLAWDIFKNSESDPEGWLLPSHFVIQNRKPRVRIEITVRQYRINPGSDPRRFQLAVPQGTKQYSLKELGEGLKGF